MDTLELNVIGSIVCDEDGFSLCVDERYRPTLAGLEGFSHVQVLWWFSGCDNAAARGSLVEYKPYKNSPDVLGAFATRSPCRPNPIALSCAGVTYIDRENGIVGLTYIDAANGSPLLDIKPYTPSLDRVEAPRVPGWCAHWPKDVDSSGDFDWEDEFNF